jgi:transcriptional regulator with XRE-family HTH domain
MEMAANQGERIASLLRNAIRLSSRTYRDVERQLGWRAGTITRLMRGGLGLKIEHLLSILAAIKLSPARFFAVAYPTASAPEGSISADERLFRILQQMYSGNGHGELARAAASSQDLATTTQDEIDEMVRISLRKLLGNSAEDAIPSSGGPAGGSAD